MKKCLPIFLIFVFLSFLFAVFAPVAFSQSKTLQTEVKAQVGQFYLDVSGFVSPYASIVAKSEGLFLGSTTADSEGNFRITSVLIKRGFSGFCLTAVDFQRLGESNACFSFPPAEGNVVMRDIFLPPTLGLLRSEINVGTIAYAFGYTMPQALVNLYLNTASGKSILGEGFIGQSLAAGSSSGFSGIKLVTTAKRNGYYEFPMKGLSAGEYKLYAKANYKNKESQTPSKQLKLKMLSFWDRLLVFLKELWTKIVTFFTSTALGRILLGVLIIILLIILFLLLWRRRRKKKSPERSFIIRKNRLLRLLSGFFKNSPR